MDIGARGMAAAAAAKAVAGTYDFGGERLDPALVPRLVNALVSCEAGVAPARNLFAFCGDSTMAGTRGSGDLRANAYPTRLLPLMQAYCAIDENGFYGNNISTGNVSDIATYDPRISVGSGIVFGTDKTIGGYGYNMSAATGPLIFTPTKAYDTLDLVLIAGGAGGNVGVQFGSGTVNTVVGRASNYTLATLTKSLGTEPVNITTISGAQVVVSATLRNSAAPKVMLANMAKAGLASGDFVSNTNNRTYLNVLYAMQPLAVFINFGINDWSLGTPVETFAANLQTAIDKLKADSDIILSVPFPSSLASYPTQGAYTQAIRDLAKLNNLPLIDFGKFFGSYEFSQPLGRYADTRHPSSTLGYGQTAKQLARVLRKLLAF